MSTSPRAETGALPATRALLWDLDNVAPRLPDLPGLARTLAGLLQQGSPLIASAHRHTWKTRQVALIANGFEVPSGGRRRDGPDRILLRRAKMLREQGITAFIVVSNDHRFAQIAKFADLHVLTMTEAYLSVRLRGAAKTVSVLEGVDGGWHVAQRVTEHSSDAHAA